PSALRRRHRRRRSARPRATRTQHGDRDRAQPVHWLRRDRRHRERVGEERQIDPRARAGTRTAGRSPPRRNSFRRVDDERRDRGGARRRTGREGGTFLNRARVLFDVSLVLSALLVVARDPSTQPTHPATRPALPASPAPPALPAPPAPSKPKLFDPLDLGLLEAPDRDQWWKPDQVMD